MTPKTRPQKGRGAPAASLPKAEEAPPEITEPVPPPDDDPKAQADFFITMLDAFAQANTVETKRIRQALIDAINAYSDDGNKVRAAVMLKQTLAGIELGMAEVLRRILARVRDRMLSESKRLGVTSPDGDLARRGAEGFTLVVHALTQMVQAARGGDDSLREQARATLALAQKKIENVIRP